MSGLCHNLTDIQTYRHTDIQTYRHTDIQTYRHTDIQTYRQLLNVEISTVVAIVSTRDSIRII